MLKLFFQNEPLFTMEKEQDSKDQDLFQTPAPFGLTSGTSAKHIKHTLFWPLIQIFHLLYLLKNMLNSSWNKNILK